MLTLIFQNYIGHGETGRVRNRKRRMSHAELPGNLGRSAMKAEIGPTPRFPYYLDLQPVHPTADARPKRLGGCLFGGKSSGQAFTCITFPQTVGLLGRGENAVQEPLSKTVQRLLNARDFNQVRAAADDHAVYQPNIRGPGRGAGRTFRPNGTAKW